MSTPSSTLFDSKLTPVITETPDSVSIGENVSENTNSFTKKIGGFFNSSIVTYTVVFLILAVLGINIFSYLGYLTENTTQILRPLLFIGITSTSDVSQEIVKTSGEGTKAATDIVTGTINSAINTTSNLLTQSSEEEEMLEQEEEDDLEEEKVREYEQLQNDVNKKKNNVQVIPEPDDATSSTQKKQGGKSGYCYIGEDRGFRSCIEVTENDTCMSGNIFPTEQICINPSLREGTEKYN